MLSARNQMVTPFSHCPSTAFLPIAQMPDETDAKKISTGELEETTRTSSYYVNEDYPAGPEIQ